jgi:hypothetical protein
MRIPTRRALALAAPLLFSGAFLLGLRAAEPPAPAPATPAPAPAAQAAPAAPTPAVSAPAAPGAKVAAPAPAAVAGGEKKAANHPKAIEIINRYLDALGGPKVLETVTDRVQKFRNTKHAASGDTVAALNQYIKKGEKLTIKVREEWDIEKVEIKGNPLSFTQVYNGSDGWVQMFGTVSPLEGRTLGLFVWDKYLDDSFCHWQEDGYTVDYIGPGTVDNEAAEIIEVTDFAGARKERYFFSKDSGLLLKKEWKEQGQNGLAKKEIAYKKYNKIPFGDGSSNKLNFALLHQVFEDGDLDTTREFTEVKINSGLKDTIFDRPPGEEFKGGIGSGDVAPAFREKGAPKATPKTGTVTPGGGHPVLGGSTPKVEAKVEAPPAPAPKAEAPPAAK